MSANFDLNNRPDYDSEIQQLADYVMDDSEPSAEALTTAKYCLMDTLGCGFMALDFPECRKLLGPVVAGTVVPFGARVPGTQHVMDPEKAAWDIGCVIRWLDFNDTWLAAEWGHPSDNLGALLAVMDYLSQVNRANGDQPFTLKDLLKAMIKAHEIQGGLALENSFNQCGLDHVLLVRVASTAVTTRLLGGNREQVLAAISHAWVDGSALRTYRHAPNAGSRKSWAAGDATARGVRLARIAMTGEMGIPGALTAKQWGFYDVAFRHRCKDQSPKSDDESRLRFQMDLGSYVMENILFKISFPAEFHSQTACEAAVRLHDQVKDRMDQIKEISITTHESAIRIISKKGPLANPADRDHCLQYMVAVALLTGDLVAENYEDSFHLQHPEIDQLREKMSVQESSQYSTDYHDPDKRSIANALQVHFQDGTSTDLIEIEYPLGHRRRREEGIPVLRQKFERAVAKRFSDTAAAKIIATFDDGKFSDLGVDHFCDLLTDGCRE